jgi:hypothetical protein
MHKGMFGIEDWFGPYPGYIDIHRRALRKVIWTDFHIINRSAATAYNSSALR